MVVAAGLHPHRIPAHRERRAELGLFPIGAQPLARLELAIIHMAARVQPAQRRFGQIDRHPPPALRGQVARGAFAGHFAFHQMALHGSFP
jgi:hypothetical protein